MDEILFVTECVVLVISSLLLVSLGFECGESQLRCKNGQQCYSSEQVGITKLCIHVYT